MKKSVNIDSLLKKNKAGLSELEGRLAFSFQDRRLLQKALIHSSFAFEQGEGGTDNEIMEFLGDAVLDLAVGQLLHQRSPEMQEGELTRLRAALVNEGNLSLMARDLGLGEYLCLGRGEEATRGREKNSILAGAYEAVAGAVFLDGGFDRAADFVQRHFAPRLDRQEEEGLAVDAKSRLQEKIQEMFSEAPEYLVVNEEGPDHRKVFTVAVRFRAQVMGTGSARSKKEAEQAAAAAALQDIDKVLPG